MDVWKIAVDVDISVFDALKKLNETARGILLLVEDGAVKATITDGDIRRHIISNGDLSEPISKVANYHFKHVSPDDIETAHRLVSEGTMGCVPVISSEGKLLSAVFPHDEIEKEEPLLDVPVIIMAGGKGTRLYPFTKILPKPLIPIGDVTITERIIKEFMKFGCSDFSLIVNHQKNLIKAYFADQKISYDISFIDEDIPLGTGGGLKLLEGDVKSTFFLTNCDIIIHENYANILEFHKHEGNIITLVSATKNVNIPYGTLEMNGEGTVTKITEKPSFSFLTNTGFYVIEPKFLDYIKEGEFAPITDIIENCIANNEKVGTYPISEDQWLDMGQLSELEVMKKRMGVE